MGGKAFVIGRGSERGVAALTASQDIAVPDIPRTASGKIVELAVRDIVNGREVKNRDALANPEALDVFADLAELKG